MLFLELALIRWTSENIVYLAFFSNLVLLASFLGIGLGFLSGKRNRFAKGPIALAALVLGVGLLPVTARLVVGHPYYGLFGGPALPQWVELPALFVGVVAVMTTIGEGVAGIFGRFEPLVAYKLDISGSILGIGVFGLLSLLHAPPVVWGAIVVCTYVVLLGAAGLGRIARLGLAVIVLVLGVQSLAPHDTWSPYYKITTVPRGNGVYAIDVNGHPHQSIVPIALLKTARPIYFAPYGIRPDTPLNNVLIVGAGTGNDVAVALSEGAKHIDAVEIDPVLYRIGLADNTDRPYQNPAVHVTITDGRAFLHSTSARYDLILFALPDSLTLMSGQSSIRLESYLFTLQAMQEARQHLAPGGVFAMYNYYQPFVLDRYANTLREVYGHSPCEQMGSTGTDSRPQAALVIANTGTPLNCQQVWHPITSPVPPPATDDHPFPYLRSNSVPNYYLLSLLAILIGAAIAIRTRAGSLMPMRRDVDLFFMGAAFLLIETKTVTQFALLFGTTWFVNALVFLGVLISVLAAVTLAQRIRLPRPWILYALLLIALAVSWAVPPETLLAFPYAGRFASAAAIAFAPIFLANLVFAQRFASTESSTLAFGANLLGAMVGGALEYGALVVGYRALAIVAAVLYAGAFLTRPRARAREGAAVSRAG